MGRLKDFCLHITDGEHRSCLEDINSPYIMLNNQNITETGIRIMETDRHISDQDFRRVKERVKLEKGDVVLSTCGTIGKVQVIADADPKYVFSRSVGIIKCDPKKLLPEFLKYYFMQSLVQTRLKMLASGMPGHICIRDLREFEVDMPDMEVQKDIIGKLDWIKRKMQNNWIILLEIEALAKLIYEYWFVQFDFPDKEGKPYKSSSGVMRWDDKLRRDIPKEWEVCEIGDLVELKDGQTYTGMGNGTYPVYSSGGILRYADQYMYYGQSVIVPRKGSLDGVQYVDGAFWAADTVYYAKELLPHSAIYLYYVLKNYDLWRLNTGSSVPSLTKTMLSSIKIVLPSEDVLAAFDAAANKMLHMAMYVKQENNQLSILQKEMLDVLIHKSKGNGIPLDEE